MGGACGVWNICIRDAAAIDAFSPITWIGNGHGEERDEGFDELS